MTILLGVLAFILVVVLLVALLLIARTKLLPSTEVTLDLGPNQKPLKTETGQSLLDALRSQGIFVPSACGGQGTCGACKCRVLEGAGDLLPTERAHINRQMQRDHLRLACQVKVKNDMKLELDPSLLGAKRWECTVISNDNVATFIKNLVLKIDPSFTFRAGGYIQVEAPAHEVAFADFDIAEPYRDAYKPYNHLKSKTKVPVTRAYSMANHPLEQGQVSLNVRIATPPRNVKNAPPGVMSSYLFNLKPGDSVTILGPFGEFFARDTNKEMIFVGGGAGMAPMRSHIFDQLLRLNSKRKITFWYGARSLKEAFFIEDFDKLQAEHENFTWHLALSEPEAGDPESYPRGFIHQVLFENYLKNHPAPEDVEYYLCGPPMMISSVKAMLDSLGVDAADIMCDDFGN